MNKGDDKFVDVFHSKCLCKILCVEMNDHVRPEGPEYRSKDQEMEDDCFKTGSRQRLLQGIYMGTGGKTKEGATEDNMEEHGRKGEGRWWLALMEGGMSRSG